MGVKDERTRAPRGALAVCGLVERRTTSRNQSLYVIAANITNAKARLVFRRDKLSKFEGRSARNGDLPNAWIFV